ncbi:hypothetical protein TSOC_010814 [Tetrabaena socialis]|uniref:Oxidoreductase-like domain-containing protein n=1 Tax=Tetrabaena socialis TaxID=47790 RepID=A0A2J7ZSE4_9CHLO|nr:hypothetical protein TSOC_010814 [Tetrabaena socialis]|eukprot:PNH03193.1 hypothetical protein TSOC_010814 [Tetrabaena socialis]
MLLVKRALVTLLGGRGQTRVALVRRVSLPARPQEPGPEDCCQNGCAVCVWDLYWAALAESGAEVADGDGGAESAAQPVSVGLTAFEELEKELAAKEEERLKKQTGSTPTGAG